jgi:ABC-type phosphate/phosphonate transport system substrate-binding protein
MFFGNIFNLWGYPSDEQFLQGELSDDVRQKVRQYLDGLKSKKPEQRKPNGVIIDGEYEDITNKRALPGEIE